MTPKLGHYRTILADPPWSFQGWVDTGTPHRTEEDHYRVTSTDALAALPVGSWAAKDAVLIMWVVDSHLKQGIALGEAWGFEYKTRLLTWVKLTKGGNPKLGMGFWTRKTTEMALLFAKGSPKRVSRGVRDLIETFETDDVIRSQARQHSRKPDEQYEKIEALVDGPYLELFARQRRPGWHSWGDEIGKFNPLSAAEQELLG